ncbi:hypothetical protein [Marinicellulosiphila megalodicopiae]|uniref:hypothetical protein n=1 Tax=Marinicellulosiphila megalodicopiae TaxID=2724896 RepID=UPI003BAFD6B6
MTVISRKKFPNMAKKQSGLATILVVIVIGMLLTTATLAVISNNRSTQERQLATHAIVHSQAGLWSGVELLKDYIKKLTDEEKLNLTDQTINIALADTNSAYKIDQISYTQATLTEVENVKAHIYYQDVDAKSNSAMEVYFEFVELGCDENVESCSDLDGNINLYGDLDLKQAIEIDVGENTKVNVAGNITFSDDGSMQGIDDLNATGNIDLGSSTNHFEFIKSNGTFTASGGSATSVSSRGAITLLGTFVTDLAHSNSTITSASSEENLIFLAQSNIFLEAGSNVDYVRSNAKVDVKGEVVNVEAQGDVDVAANIHNVETIKLYGDSYCIEGTNWDSGPEELTINQNPVNVVSPTMGLSTSNCAENDELIFDDTLVVETVPEVPLYEMNKPNVNIWELKELVNYAFSYDQTQVIDAHKIRVYVKNIKEKAQGSYYVVGAGSQQKFCLALTMGQCDLTQDYILPCLGEGNEVVNSCFAVELIEVTPEIDLTNDDLEGSVIVQGALEEGEVTTDPVEEEIQEQEYIVTWKLQGHTIAPGSYFFEGDVIDNTQFSITTKLATNNYYSGGVFKDAMAPNFAGYKALCLNNYEDLALLPQASTWQQSTNFINYSPLQFCDFSEEEAINTKSGNIVIGSGGTNPSVSPLIYEGGIVDFTLGTSSRVFGTIMAGDHLVTVNDIGIHGAVVALNDNDSMTVANELSGSSAITYDSAIGGYDPTILPTSNCTAQDGTWILDENGDSTCVDAVIPKDEIIPSVSWARFL